MTSISYVDAGKPSTPSTQQLQPVTPGTPSPTTPETNPANTPQSSGSNVSATDNTNQQGGFLSTSAGQAAVVGGVAGVGAMAVGIYVNEKLLSNTNSSVESAEKFLETLRLERKGRVAEVAAVIEDSEEILKNSRNFRKAIEQRTLTPPSNSLATPPSYQIKKRLNQEELKTAIDNVRNNISNLKFNNTNYKGAFTMAQGKVINELSKNELSPAAYQWLSVLHRNGDLDNFAHRESLEQLLGHHEALQAEEADKKLTTGYTLGSNSLPLNSEKGEALPKEEFEQTHSHLQENISKINHKGGSNSGAFYSQTKRINTILNSINHEEYHPELHQRLHYVWENMDQQSPGGEHIKKLLDHYTALARKTAKVPEVKK